MSQDWRVPFLPFDFDVTDNLEETDQRRYTRWTFELRDDPLYVM